ncbi:MAG: AI-2E family transporter [Elusimicrobia bacterium]|nr:AI-2E family transporter [Elusimicrobiota bacterium]
MESKKRIRIAAQFLFAGLLLLAAVFHLGAALLAGLFSYTILDMTNRRLTYRAPRRGARWLSLGIFILASSFLGGVFWFFVRQTVVTVPSLLADLVPKLAALARHYHVPMPFDNINELREAVLYFTRENVSEITHASGLLTRQFFHVAIGIFVSILCFMSDAPEGPFSSNLYDVLRGEFNERISRFMRSFERMLSAQVTISGINTFLTAIFLVMTGFPHITFLIPATFVLGILPIIGNVLSNTIIVSTGLTLSAKHAILALIFLVAIHKGEYLLNSRIMGASFRIPMWQVLLGILVGEVVLGVPGIVLAPAVLHYIREEMQSIPVEDAA